MNTAFGPQIRNTGEKLLALEWVVNGAITGKLPGFRSAVERGESVQAYPLFARRPDADEDLSASRAEWQAMTGNELGNDVYSLGVAFSAKEVLLPRSVLLKLVDQLMDVRSHTPKPPGPWLFRPDPISSDPAPREEAELRQLEKEAAEFDRMAQAIDPKPDSASIAAKRRFLLIELDACGLTHVSCSHDKRRWLETWRLEKLLDYFDAAMQIHAYFESPERRDQIPEAKDQPVPGSRVSLDWYRWPHQPPPDVTPREWLAFCERTLMDAPSTDGYEGRILTHVDDYWYQTHWRKDDGTHPAVVSATFRNKA